MTLDQNSAPRFVAASGRVSDELRRLLRSRLPLVAGIVVVLALTGAIAAKLATNGGFSPAGPVSTASAVPSLPSPVPKVTATSSPNSITLSWEATSPAGTPINSVEIETTDGGVRAVATSGSVTEGNGRGQTKSIRARAKDVTGQWGPWSNPASASTWEKSSYTVTLGQHVTQPQPAFCQAENGGCYHLNISLRRYNPNSTVYCFVQGVGAPDWTGTTVVDGSGNADWTSVSGPMGKLLADDQSWVGATCEQR